MRGDQAASSRVCSSPTCFVLSPKRRHLSKVGSGFHDISNSYDMDVPSVIPSQDAPLPPRRLRPSRALGGNSTLGAQNSPIFSFSISRPSPLPRTQTSE